MSLRRLYVNLVVAAMIIGPAWWLLLTEDGKRRTDAVMLWLWGQKEVGLELRHLAPYGEEALLALYDDLDWRCASGGGAFGERRCTAAIGVFNGIPARSLTFYFRDGMLSALKVVYRRRYHEALLQDLRRRLGQPRSEAGVLRWSTDEGLLVVKQRMTPADEAALIWIAKPPPRDSGEAG
jgi:hypothetical protein